MKLSAVAFVLAVLLQAAFAQTVNLAVLAPGPGNIQYQEKPILATTVSPAGTGVVTGYIDGNQVGTCQTTAASGACNISATTQSVLTVGNHQAIVSYTPTAGTTTNSSVVTFQVFATTILITTSNPSGPNVPAGLVTFTVSTQNVPSNIGGPSGTITFVDASHGGAVVGTCQITGVSTCSANATLAPGTNYTVFAQYPGDTVFDQAFSPSIFLEVAAATTGSTATSTTASIATATSITTTAASSTTANTTTATLTSSTSTTAASSTTTSTDATASTSTTAASSTTSTAATSTTTASSTTTAAATLTSGTSTTATPTPVPTATGTTNPTGPATTGQISTTTSNNTHPTAAPTKAPTSAAAWTLPSMVFSAVVIALACL